MSENIKNRYARRDDSDPWQQMAREAAEKAVAEQKKREEAEEGHGEYATKDDIAYQRKLMKMAERDESFDPLENKEIERSENTATVKDYDGGEHPKPGIMNGATFDENGWLVSNQRYEKTREGRDITKSYEDWYDRFTDKMNEIPQMKAGDEMPDGSERATDEDPKDYQHRVAIEAFRDIIAGYEDTFENWKFKDYFTPGELNALRTEFPRHKDDKGDYDETYDDWLKRVEAEIRGTGTPGDSDKSGDTDKSDEDKSGDDKSEGDKSGDDKSEKGDKSEEGESEEEPVDIDKLAQDLIKARKDMREGATWDKEQRTYIGEDGLPRDWAHLVSYLKNNPDAIKTAKEVLAKLQAENDSNKDEKSEEDPLIAMLVDRERDAKIAARMVAEEALHDKLESKKGGAVGRAIRNLVFGQILRDRTLIQFESEAMEAIQEGRDEVRGVNIGKYWTKEADGAGGKVVERLTMAYTEGMEDALLHSEAGNTMVAYGIETTEDGKKVVYRYENGKEAAALGAESRESKVTLKVHELIEQFAKGDLSEHDFDEQVKALKYDLHDKQGLSYEAVGSLVSDTLLETAKAAKERFDHEGGIENVMKGFRLIDADYQSQIRTEAHRSKIDELSEKISNMVGIAQPEVIATALGLLTYAMQTGTSSMARIVAPVIGSSLVSGVFQGFKEHNRVAVDRAEQARRIARGENYGDTKYDDDIHKTLYDARIADAAADKIDELIANGDTEELLIEYTELKTKMDYSDRRKIDLIRYNGDGSTESIEDQRLKLDLALAKAKVELRNRGVEDDGEQFKNALEGAEERVQEDIDKKDAVFKKLQRKRVAAQVAKTVAVGTAIGVVGQETVATFNPNSYGIFDKLNETANIRFEPLNIGVNNDDATKTMLASVLGIKTLGEELAEQATQNTTNIIAASNVKLTDQQRARLESDGYHIIDRQHTVYKPSTHVEQISGSEYVDKYGIRTSVEYMHNGTPGIYDGNELRGYQGVNGDNSIWFSKMFGESFNGSTVVDTSNPLVQQNMCLAVYLDGSSEAIFIPGVPSVVNGENVISYASNDPTMQQILANRAFDRIVMAYRTGETLADGSERILSLASLGGSGTASNAMFETTVTEMIPEVETVSTVIGQRISETASNAADIIGRTSVAVPLVKRKNLTLPEDKPKNGPTGGEPTPTEPTPEPTEPTTPENGSEQEEKNKLLNEPEFRTRGMKDYMSEQGIEDETTLTAQQLNDLLNGFRSRNTESASEGGDGGKSSPDTPSGSNSENTTTENEGNAENDTENEEKQRILNEPEFKDRRMADYMREQGFEDETVLTAQQLTDLLNGFRNRGNEPAPVPTPEPTPEPAPAPAPENNETGENTDSIIPITDVNDTRPIKYTEESLKKFSPSADQKWLKEALDAWNNMTSEQRHELMVNPFAFRSENNNESNRRRFSLFGARRQQEIDPGKVYTILSTYGFIQTPNTNLGAAPNTGESQA